jgi:hypothetical protein
LPKNYLLENKRGLGEEEEMEVDKNGNGNE